MDATPFRFDRILVPLDGSPLSEQALLYAETIARSGTNIVLLRVIPDFDDASLDPHVRLGVAVDEGRRRLHLHALRELHRAADQVRRAVPGANLEVVVADGDPSDEILRAASEHEVGLIVMASEGFGTRGRFGLGSVADRVARTSAVPVLIVRDRGRNVREVPSPVRRIVVPLDGSDRAAQALVVAEDLAKRLRVPVLLITVIDVGTAGPRALCRDADYSQDLYRELFGDLQLDAQRTLDRAGARLVLRGISVDSRLLAGPAAATIMDATRPGDVVVMTSRGRGGSPRWPIGSVAEKLIASGPVPVVLVSTGREPEIVAPVVDDIYQREPIGAE
jgi:nucleotide-binding universal stress UspA family protein